MTGHHALTEVPALGIRATRCEVAARHRPTPLRFVLHHVLPQVCGGLTVPGNLAQLCDNDHYAVHALLRYAATHDGQFPGRVGTRTQRDLAARGYQAAVAAGTVDRIPDEGNVGWIPS